MQSALLLLELDYPLLHHADRVYISANSCIVEKPRCKALLVALAIAPMSFVHFYYHCWIPLSSKPEDLYKILS